MEDHHHDKTPEESDSLLNQAGDALSSVYSAGVELASDASDHIRDFESRKMTEGEIEFAKEYFDNKVNYDDVEIVNGEFIAGTGMTVGNKIYMGNDYQEDYTNSKRYMKGEFLKQMTHVWQEQNGMNVTAENTKSYLRGETGVYKAEEGKSFGDYSAREQALIVADSFYLKTSRLKIMDDLLVRGDFSAVDLSHEDAPGRHAQKLALNEAIIGDTLQNPTFQEDRNIFDSIGDGITRIASTFTGGDQPEEAVSAFYEVPQNIKSPENTSPQLTNEALAMHRPKKISGPTIGPRDKSPKIIR